MARRESKKPDDVSIEQLRGVVSFDTSEVVLLVRAPVEDVASAFLKHHKLRTWVRHALGKELIVAEPSYVVYRLKGHTWTIIDAFKPASVYPIEEIAIALSSELAARVIIYLNSETAGGTDYAMYDQGKQLERFSAWERIEFDSKLREVSAPQERSEIYEFVRTFMRDQDALAPGWTHLYGSMCYLLGDKFKLDMPPDLFERIDYLSA